MEILNEMVYTIPDAMDRCHSLGEQFANHFNKVCSSTKESDDFVHHCIEMQAGFDQVKDIILKHNNKKITYVNLIDWFFTYGNNVENIIDEQYVDLYNVFIIKLLNSKTTSIKDILIDLL